MVKHHRDMSSVMTVEDKQMVLSVLLAAVLSVVIVGVALLSTVLLTDRPRPTLENALSVRPDVEPSSAPLSPAMY